MKDTKKEELLKRLEDGVQSTFTSQHFKAYLRMASLFHGYSANNIRLILMQKPEATRVAGFNTWKTLNRFVQRGEKGIYILAPMKMTVHTQEGIKNPDGTTTQQDVEKQILRFRTVSVFDVSQTAGEPLPEICKPLEGSVDQYARIFQALKDVANPYTVEFENIRSGAHGYCQPKLRRIALDIGTSDAQTVKTLCHELAHSRLHESAISSREQKEVEAEATAFILCDHLGLDTSSYTFDYIADWAQHMDFVKLSATLEGIQQQAHELIAKIDTTLEALQMEQTHSLPKINLADRLQAAQKAAAEKNAPHIAKEMTQIEQPG